MNKLITKKQVEELITIKYPEQMNYWLHNNGRKKHTEIIVPTKCPICDYEETLTIKGKSELNCLLKENCPRCEAQDLASNDHLNIPLPFGKFKGQTINAVMLEEPSYLAWFVDQIEGQNALVEQIKSHTRFPEVWAAYVESKMKWALKVIQEQREWQTGKFSSQTVNDVCDTLFRVRVYGEEDRAV